MIIMITFLVNLFSHIVCLDSHWIICPFLDGEAVKEMLEYVVKREQTGKVSKLIH